MVTIDGVRMLAVNLPRTTEAIVRDRVKFRVGRIVYLAFSRDETVMGFAFPKAEREALVTSEPEKFMMPGQSDLRYHWVHVRLAAIDEPEMRELVVDAWRMVVPKRVAAAYDAGTKAGGQTTTMDNMTHLEEIVGRLPQAERVDVEEWGDHPTFRVNGKNFVFSDQEARHLSVKLSKDEAAAVVATDDHVDPAGYGLGRHGWIALTLEARPSNARWRRVEEWIRTSYTLVAPKKLARLVVEQDARPSAEVALERAISRLSAT
jgi:hypothetical protein